MSEFTISEDRLARRLGTPRGVVRGIRKFAKQGLDFEVVGSEVRLTKKMASVICERCAPDGVTLDVEAVLRTALAEPLPDEGSGQGDGKAQEFGPVEMILTVDRPTRNRHIVMAWVNEPVAQADLVRVQVQSSKNFAAGMRIRCRHIEEDLWELVGRAPRSRRDVPMREEDGDEG